MKRYSIESIIYVILVYLALATSRQHIYTVTYFSQYLFGIAITVMCFILLVIKGNMKLHVNKKLIRISVLLFIPIVLFFLYSMILDLVNPTAFVGYVSRAFGLVAYCALAILQAFFVCSYFGARALDYTFIAVSLSYLTSIIVAFYEGGLSQFVLMFTDTSYNGSVLEMHEVAPIAALFTFYYLYRYRYKGDSKKKTVKNELICAIIIFLSMKRIVLLCCLLMIILFEVLSLFKNRIKALYRTIVLISIIVIIVALGFIWGIKSGALFAITTYYHINAMGRWTFWNNLASNFSFSVLYPGRGLGYTSKWIDSTWRSLNITGLSSSTGIHSDILKFYVDFGFCGFVFYLVYLLIYITKKIKNKIGSTEFLLYFILMLQQVIIWFTDNISVYHNYQWILYLIILSSRKKSGSTMIYDLTWDSSRA